ncbi:pantoate--beta-alanine ligase [Bacteroidota bacterium]
MIIITTAIEMTNYVNSALRNGVEVGLVPTMGALHQGHLSLIDRAKKENQLVVVSIFVNPVQFNRKEDLEKYPRTFELDKTLLEQASVDALFYPSVNEIYPIDKKLVYDMDGLDASMEGPNRPGHFNGVIQAVTRLLDIVQPTRAYFGEKDFQQLAIIKHMTQKLGYNLEIIGCPTLREADGLAMSSRNVLLRPDERKKASVIFQVLSQLKKEAQTKSIMSLKEEAIDVLKKVKGSKLEYLELVNPDTLEPVDDSIDGSVQACVAIWLGGVRLIDNMQVK